MEISKRFSFLALALLLGVLACEMPSTLTRNRWTSTSSIQLSAETVMGAQTQSAVPGTPLTTKTNTSTFTPEPPTLTSTPNDTPTPSVPMIRVSVDTNCRSGPGKTYDYSGALLVDKIVEVLARDPSGNYYYIRNPSSGEGFCWVWGGYATISGDVSALRMYTPLPSPSPTVTPVPSFTATPVPSFKVAASDVDRCDKNWWVDIKLINNDQWFFKSYNISVKDRLTEVTLTYFADVFADLTGCDGRSIKYVIQRATPSS